MTSERTGPASRNSGPIDPQAQPSRVVLEPLGYANWREAARLEVTATQVGFFPNLLETIVEAQFFPTSRPYLIRANVATPEPGGEPAEVAHAVGFAVYGRDAKTGRRKIFRFVIDRRHQGRGYGRDALALIVDEFFGDPACAEVFLSYSPGHEIAAALFRSFGFREEARLKSERNEGGEKIECRLGRAEWEEHRARALALSPEALAATIPPTAGARPPGLAGIRPKPSCC